MNENKEDKESIERFIGENLEEEYKVVKEK